ncbi:hypothetical protein CO180_02175 [candidate division WWE3 bacterium CG_4_9_14_3_um_filter_41_6]|uniref:DNA-directed DNA polymerase n=1 Tax=candidate division WWE3 bacterium CG_4_10_14_0_2_um_filter_41_14 TaxID=1975072 RepID=A0A2M7TK77_UNCKA|nr:MAG: hypothetical protein COY32_02405 [candidate division WWE3 bacterium CG_4_10_14_0_2_um_filter_41_14]PJA38876.1 MAG: hypothetical protein CO180_02175 [candidate division WWE3 bacterium CG_4_9_14_3_um_filter_41_6]
MQNYHIFGPDHFSAKKYIRGVGKSLGISIEFYSFHNEIERALDNLSQQSLFGKEDLMVFRDNQDLLDASLEKLLTSTRPWVVWETSEKSKYSSKTKQALLKVSQVVEMPLLSEQMTRDWITKTALKYRLNLSGEEIISIQEATDSDLTMIQNELQKIFWISKGSDSKDQLSLLSGIGQPISIFPVIDAIALKRTKVFLTTYRNFITQGIDEWQLFFALSRLIQNLYLAKINALVGLPQFVISKIRNQSQQWTKDELIEFATKLSEYEYDVKTGDRPSIKTVLFCDIMKRVYVPAI